MVQWFKKQLVCSTIIIPLSGILLFSFIITSYLMIPCSVFADGIIEFAPKLAVPKNQDLTFTVSVKSPVDSVLLYFRRLSSIDPFRELALTKTSDTSYTGTLTLTAWEFNWEKIEYYLAAFRGSRRVDVTETFIVNFIEKPQISDVTVTYSDKLNKTGFEELFTVPIWKKWWFWVPVTVAVGAGVYFAIKPAKKSEKPLKISNFRVEVLSGPARCRQDSTDCTDIEARFHDPCEPFQIQYLIDITSGTPPFDGTWSISYWEYPDTTPKQRTETFHTSDKLIVTQPITDCCWNYPKQNSKAIPLSVDISDKNKQSVHYEDSVTFWVWPL